MCKCKMCGHTLTNPESIKRGMGKVCYRIFKLREASKPEPENKVNTEIAFLKLEIKTLKRMIRNIQVKGAINPIERIKQNRPEQKTDGNESNFGSVITEMKEIFSNIKSVYEYLKPVNPIEEPTIPPIAIPVLA